MKNETRTKRVRRANPSAFSPHPNTPHLEPDTLKRHVPLGPDHPVPFFAHVRRGGTQRRIPKRRTRCRRAVQEGRVEVQPIVPVPASITTESASKRSQTRRNAYAPTAKRDKPRLAQRHVLVGARPVIHVQPSLALAIQRGVIPPQKPRCAWRLREYSPRADDKHEKD